MCVATRATTRTDRPHGAANPRATPVSPETARTCAPPPLRGARGRDNYYERARCRYIPPLPVPPAAESERRCGASNQRLFFPLFQKQISTLVVSRSQRFAVFGRSRSHHYILHMHNGLPAGPKGRTPQRQQVKKSQKKQGHCLEPATGLKWHCC